jgi:hypothetical protein
MYNNYKAIILNFGTFIEIFQHFQVFKTFFHDIAYQLLFLQKLFVTNVLIKYIWNKKIISW